VKTIDNDVGLLSDYETGKQVMLYDVGLMNALEDHLSAMVSMPKCLIELIGRPRVTFTSGFQPR
jgi:hypothetical protein